MFEFLFSILIRYFSRQFIWWFLISLGTILAIVSLFEGVELLRRAMGLYHVQFSTLLEMILLKIPAHVQRLLPFVVFFGAVLSFWRLNLTQEVTAARAAGMSVWQLVAGLSIVIIGIGIINLALINPIGAAMSARLGQLEEKVFRNPSNKLSISAGGIWLREASSTNKSIFYASSFNLQQKEFYKATFYEYDTQDQYVGRYEAENVYLRDGAWELKDVTYVDKENNHHKKNQLSRTTDLSLTKIQESYANPETLSFWKIPEFMQTLEETGLSSLRYKMYWHSQISKIGLMIAMVLLAASFCLHPVRYRNPAKLIALAVFSSFAIHFTSDVIYALGMAEKIPVLLATWMPALFASMLSLTFLLHYEAS